MPKTRQHKSKATIGGEEPLHAQAKTARPNAHLNKSKSVTSVGGEASHQGPSKAAWNAFFKATSQPSKSAQNLPRSLDENHAPQNQVMETESDGNNVMMIETSTAGVQSEKFPPNVSSDVCETSTHQETNAEMKRRGRGPNKVMPTPANPEERKFISTLHQNCFSDPKVVRAITKGIQVHLTDAWPTWRKIPKAIQEEIWSKFQEKFTWAPDDHANVRKAWELTCQNRFKGMMDEERKKAKEHFGVSDIGGCKDYNKGWIRVDIWNRLVDTYWDTPEWKMKSEKNKQNRLSEKDGGITKHTGGSIPFSVHGYRMSKEKQRPATFGEVFDRTHKRKKGTGDYVDPKSKSVAQSYVSCLEEKYGPDHDEHPEFDPDAWCKAIGGMETTRTHVYGFGTTPRAKQIFNPSSSPAETASSACGPATKASGNSTEFDQLRQEMSTMKDEMKGFVESQDEIKSALLTLAELFGQFRHGTSTNAVGSVGGSSKATNGDSHDKIDSDDDLC